MIVIRDMDTSEAQSQEILNKLGMAKEAMSVLDESVDPLAEDTDGVLLITSMPSGWLGYHQNFFEKHRRDASYWIVLLLNDDPIVIEQAKIGFNADGIRLCLKPITDNTDFGQVLSEIKSVSKVNKQKVFLYSIRPNCGKKTLTDCLQEDLEGWAFETAQEAPFTDKLAESDAAHIVIVGKTLKDFAVSVPKNMNPLYVLTMPDENVQAYLHMDELPLRLLEMIPSHLQWTEEAAASHLFYISPLYEQWRKMEIIPALDSRFIMWDNFGLPLSREAYTKENIRLFLAQFNQCDRLVKRLVN